MKTIGLIGGMSWESTQTYYRLVNQGVKEALGGLHSAKVILYSVDFAEIEALQRQGDWEATAKILAAAGRALEAAGAHFMVLCTNTMHKVAPQIERAVSIPLLHIADATARALQDNGVSRVGLLGTRFTMEQAFYRDRLEAQGIEVIVPEESQRVQIHSVIFDELCQGEIKSESKSAYLSVIDSLVDRGVQGVVLGCTEISLLVADGDTSVPLYDTTAIHAAQALRHALAKD
ncbi:aspartate/glutamate racemase family protein [Halomonadaceae bacterium KBTZ08]